MRDARSRCPGDGTSMRILSALVLHGDDNGMEQPKLVVLNPALDFFKHIRD